jgi:hypothetical protein
METPMVTEFDRLIDELAARAIMRRYKQGDYLVLSDEALRAALAGTQPLNRAELRAVLDSPLTLRRMHTLAQQARAAAITATIAPAAAANDPAWTSSRALLRAAADDGDAHSIDTDDGYWRLVFLPVAGGWRMVLRLDSDAPFAAELTAAAPTVAVLDGRGRTLMLGPLDEDGELAAPWPLPGEPYASLMAQGGRIEVVRA